MLTVTALAGRFGLSRSTLLYYESVGLMKRPPRSSGNYRAYSAQDVERLRQICVYRNAGLRLADIRVILDRKTGGDAFAVLKRRLTELDREIESLRSHQRQILQLLTGKFPKQRSEMIDKEKWVAIMRSSGFSEADMRRWHGEFEKLAPAEHQEFLEYLKIPADEIRSIRAWSQDENRAHP